MHTHNFKCDILDVILHSIVTRMMGKLLKTCGLDDMLNGLNSRKHKWRNPGLNYYSNGAAVTSYKRVVNHSDNRAAAKSPVKSMPLSATLQQLLMWKIFFLHCWISMVIDV